MGAPKPKLKCSAVSLRLYCHCRQRYNQRPDVDTRRALEAGQGQLIHALIWLLAARAHAAQSSPSVATFDVHFCSLGCSISVQ